MKIAKVVGTVVQTIHFRSLDSRRLLVCDHLDPEGEATGAYVIAVDAVGAGAGETVLVLDEGSSARQVMVGTARPGSPPGAGQEVPDQYHDQPEAHQGTHETPARDHGGQSP